MSNQIEDSPFIKMRKQFLKEKDIILARYEEEIKQLKNRIVELESTNNNDIIDVSSDDLRKPFFELEEK